MAFGEQSRQPDSGRHAECSKHLRSDPLDRALADVKLGRNRLVGKLVVDQPHHFAIPRIELLDPANQIRSTRLLRRLALSGSLALSGPWVLWARSVLWVRVVLGSRLVSVVRNSPPDRA